MKRIAVIGCVLLGLPGCDVLFPIDPIPLSPSPDANPDVIVKDGREAIIDGGLECSTGELACLLFEDASLAGGAADSSSRGHDAEVTGVISSVPRDNEQAAGFDGDGSVRIPLTNDEIAAGDGVTFAAWVNLGTTTDRYYSLASSTDGTFELSAVVDDTEHRTLSCRFGDIGGLDNVELDAPPGVWLFVACTYDPTTHELGIQAGTATNSLTSTRVKPFVVADVQLGLYQSVPLSVYHGGLDDFRIWKGVIPPETLDMIMNQN